MMKKQYYNKGRHFICSVLVTIFVLAVSIGLCASEKLGLAGWRDIFAVLDISGSACNNTDGEMSIHTIDVGKADALYINCGAYNILIDAGDVDASNTVVNYLKREGVKKLDLVIVSHAHRDHIGEMKSVINEFEIDKFMMARVPESLTPTNRTYKNMLLALKAKGIKLTQPNVGEELNFGKLSLKILSPSYRFNSDNINEYSIVVQAAYGNKKFLFMGDAGKPIEHELINSGYNLKSDVLKVGHHGSKSASSEEFIRAVSPKYAVISVGEDRSNLPKTEVLKRLNKYCANVLRTDNSGTIVLRSDGNSISVNMEKGD